MMKQQHHLIGKKRLLRGLACALASTAFPVPAMAAPPTAQDGVFAAERAFAQTMADRDLQAFAARVSDEAIFFSDGSAPLRGKRQVVDAWTRLFAGKQAPFSWAPDQVEVLDSGSLALSTGLVRDPAGKVIARFNSIWRLEAPDTWRVIFDKGSPPSEQDLEKSGEATKNAE